MGNELKYENITISGQVAVGKDTLRKNILTVLGPLGWRGQSSGGMFREITQENILPNASLAPDEIHHKIDNRVIELLTHEKNWIIEAWLSGFLARELNNTLRVLLVCENKAIKVDRVANRDKVSMEKAKEYVISREADNMKKFKQLYGDYDFWDPKYYHVVIDTYTNSQMETANLVLDALGYKSDKID